jgi:outer membrane lipoprotein-sorting protein
MVSLTRAFLVLLASLLVGLGHLRANEAAIARARAYLGSEADLAAVRSLLFKGELSVVGRQGGTPITARIEIAFQKPDRQLITATAPDKIETTALNGYEAWQRDIDPANPSLTRVGLLGRDPIKRLRANTFENLSFYRGIEGVGGRVEDRGMVTIDGVECLKLAFIHAADVVFIRSFDRATGRLVQTETDNGGLIREEGEILSVGLRFPRRTTTTNTLPDGSVRAISITFSEVLVNPVLPDELFVIPAQIP